MFFIDNQVLVVPRRHGVLLRTAHYDKQCINLMISSCKKTIDGVTTYDACMSCM